MGRRRRRADVALGPPPPLAWVPDEPLILCGDELHRPGCGHAGIVTRDLDPGEILWRVRAPIVCPWCRPGVELRIGLAA